MEVYFWSHILLSLLVIIFLLLSLPTHIVYLLITYFNVHIWIKNKSWFFFLERTMYEYTFTKPLSFILFSNQLFHYSTLFYDLFDSCAVGHYHIYHNFIINGR